MAISEDRVVTEYGRSGLSRASSIPARGLLSDLSQQSLTAALATIVVAEAALFAAAGVSDKIPSFVLTLFRALLTL
ncbi:MAG: hypothetical protein ABIT01_17630 [Thermoanaerobaculia bacterium]